MTRERAIRLAERWSEEGVCTLRDGEAKEYHAMCLAALREQEERSKGCEFCMTSVWQNANYCPRCGRKLEVEG